jgi:hypothetical protein
MQREGPGIKVKRQSEKERQGERKGMRRATVYLLLQGRNCCVQLHGRRDCGVCSHIEEESVYCMRERAECSPIQVKGESEV